MSKEGRVVECGRSALKDLRRIAAVDVPRIIAAAEALAEEPFPPGCTKLTGSERIDLGRLMMGKVEGRADALTPLWFVERPKIF